MVCRSQVSDKEWVQLQGKILLNSTVAKASIYIEGPPAGVDVLLDSLVVKHAQKAPPAPAPDFEVTEYSVLGFAFAHHAFFSTTAFSDGQERGTDTSSLDSSLQCQPLAANLLRYVHVSSRFSEYDIAPEPVECSASVSVRY